MRCSLNYGTARPHRPHPESSLGIRGVHGVNTSVEMNSFGCIVEEYASSNGPVEKIVKAPKIPSHMDYKQQEHFIKEATK